MDALMTKIQKFFPWNTMQKCMYVSGCVVFSIGAKFFIDSNLGVDPLDVLCIGMVKHMPLTMGTASGLIAIAFLSVWCVWNKQFPPLSPFFTTFAVGSMIDLWNLLKIEQYTQAALTPYAILFVGLMLCSFASSLIIMSGIGIRIMDLVAITIMKKWNWNFFSAKMLLEIFLFSSGWMLGGPVGVGTFAFLALVGPFIQPFMKVNKQYLSLPNYGIAD